MKAERHGKTSRLKEGWFNFFWAEFILNFPDNIDLGKLEATRKLSDLRIAERQ